MTPDDAFRLPAVTDGPRQRRGGRVGRFAGANIADQEEARAEVNNPLICEKCGRELEIDDAVSIIQGVCAPCRRVAESLAQPLSERPPAANAVIADGGSDHVPVFPEETPIQDPSPAPVSPRIDGEAHQTVPSSIPSVVVRQGVGRSAPQIGLDAAAGRQATARNAQGYRPPTPPFDVQPILRSRRRRRDLAVGIAFGLVVTVGITGYFLRGRVDRTRFPATEEETPRGRLPLRVSPPSATVKLDGRNVGPLDESGRVSVDFPRENPERQWLEITAAGYHPVRRLLSDCLGGPEAIIELVRMPFELVLETVPDEAEVWINGRLKGVSPLTLLMDPAQPATLRVRKRGYAELTEPLSPPGSGQRLALTLELVRSGPRVSVVCEPPGALITIDGKLRGAAPLELELPPALLGREIEVLASAEGYDEARRRITLSAEGGQRPEPTRIILSRAMARIEVRTEPPGGRIMLAGQDYGTAPATVEFDPSQTGRSIVVEASLGGSHFGRTEVAIPPPGPPVSVAVPLTFSAQRVLFVFASPEAIGADHSVLADHLATQIHRLKPTQRFGIVAATDDGMDTWPGGLGLEAASSEQKVRAYDKVRSIRPSGRIDLDELLRAAIALSPTTMWIFVEGELDRSALDRFARWAERDEISVNIVRTTSGEDESFLDRFTASRHGTLTILGRDQLPAVAFDDNAEP